MGFSGSININNLQPGTFIFQVCFDVPITLAAPLATNIISTITLTTTASITGTIIFSIRPTDIGPQPVFVLNPTKTLAPATVTWTSNIPGDPIVRYEAISLYSNPNITQSAVYSVFMSSNI